MPPNGSSRPRFLPSLRDPRFFCFLSLVSFRRSSPRPHCWVQPLPQLGLPVPLVACAALVSLSDAKRQQRTSFTHPTRIFCHTVVVALSGTLGRFAPTTAVGKPCASALQRLAARTQLALRPPCPLAFLGACSAPCRFCTDHRLPSFFSSIAACLLCQGLSACPTPNPSPSSGPSRKIPLPARVLLSLPSGRPRKPPARSSPSECRSKATAKRGLRTSLVGRRRAGQPRLLFVALHYDVPCTVLLLSPRWLISQHAPGPRTFPDLPCNPALPSINS